MEKTGNGYLENELDIKTSPKFSLTTINDTLELFESQSNLGCTVIFILLFSAILFFVDNVTLMVFFLLLTITAIRYLWRYKYTFKKKPVIIISRIGVAEKDQLYLWSEMLDLTCSEEFDNERAIFTATHLRFVHYGSVKKIYIGGYDKSIEEIIHYIAIFRNR